MLRFLPLFCVLCLFPSVHGGKGDDLTAEAKEARARRVAARALRTQEGEAAY